MVFVMRNVVSLGNRKRTPTTGSAHAPTTHASAHSVHSVHSAHEVAQGKTDRVTPPSVERLGGKASNGPTRRPVWNLRVNGAAPCASFVSTPALSPSPWPSRS